MRGCIVVYHLPRGISDAKRIGFRQRLLGAITTSHEGKYQSHRHGLLEKTPHRRLMPGAFIIRKDARAEVEEFLRTEAATFWIREVTLVDEDAPFLKAPSQD